MVDLMENGRRLLDGCTVEARGVHVLVDDKSASASSKSFQES